MEIKRCMNCMEELAENEARCPACGTDNRNIEQPNYALQCNYILHGRYLIGRVLGQGGFGITYIGMDMLLNIKVAVKEYFPMGMVTRDSGGSSKILWNVSQMGEKQRQSGYSSFLKEAQKMAKIDKIPSIVKVRDMFLDNETAYIIMEYVEGITLKQKLSQDGPMSFSDCITLLSPMMEDLAKVHKKGMVHRDISPDNIMIQPDGTVCLLDLGAAKDMTVGDGTNSQLVAKKGFSPLEQYTDGEAIGSWTDVYALCATIYYCITGKLLLDALKRIEHEELDLTQNLKVPLAVGAENALKAGLNLKVAGRTQNMEELLKQLKTGNQENEPIFSKEWETDENLSMEAASDFKQGQEAGTVPRTKPTLQQRLCKVKKSVWAVMGVSLIAAVVFWKIISASKTEQFAGTQALTDINVEAEKTPAEDTKNKIMPVMMSDVISDDSEDKNYKVLGSDIERQQISSITFLDTLENQPEDAWDVSMGQDGTVMAWVISAEKKNMYDLYIGGEGGVRAPETCDTLFYNYSVMAKVNFNNCLDTSQVSSMRGMFAGCNRLEQLELESCDMGKVTDMRNLFYKCWSLEKVDLQNFNTGQVTDMNGIFAECKRIEQLDLRNFDTSQVTDIGGMFSGCNNLEILNLENFDTSRVTNMADMFRDCNRLKNLDLKNLDTGQVKNMNRMFLGCETLNRLDLETFNTSQVTQMREMFSGCEDLDRLDLSNFDTGRVEYMTRMFKDCRSLRQLDVSSFDTRRVYSMEGMFENCKSLERLDLSNFDMTMVKKKYYMFSGCNAEVIGLE